MTVERRARPRPAATRTHAFGLSASLHALGIASALGAAATTLSVAHWSAAASVPLQPLLRDDVPPAAEPPQPPTTSVVAETAVPAPLPLDPALPDAMRTEVRPVATTPLDAIAPPTVKPTPVRHTALLARLRPAPAVPQPAPAADPLAQPASPDVQPSPQPGTNAPPPYPFVAWRRGIEGTVTVLLEIDEHGTVTAAHVEASSGCSALDDAALAQLATWRFTPARSGGHAVRGAFRQEVVFRLDG